MRGGIAWRVLAHSPVPVLLRHIPAIGLPPPREPVHRKILVPLDGSPRAEAALPLALSFAREWDASIYLVRVAPNLPMVTDMPYMTLTTPADTMTTERRAAQQYLEAKVDELGIQIHTRTYLGPSVDALCRAVEELDITDVVMASHGRTGLMRVIVGSVADELIHRLSCPIIVVPAMAAKAMAEGETITGAAIGQ